MSPLDTKIAKSSSSGKSRIADGRTFVNLWLMIWLIAAARVVVVVCGTLVKYFLVEREVSLDFDNLVRDAIHAWAWPFLTKAMEFTTMFGSWFLLAFWPILIGIVAVKGYKSAALALAITASGEVAFAEILKIWIDRSRPLPYPGIKPPSDPFSFPSGHAMASFCFYFVLAVIVSNRLHSPIAKLATWTGATLLTTLVGFSRVYLGYHYPTDVFGGYVFAMTWIVTVGFGYKIWILREEYEAKYSSIGNTDTRANMGEI